MTLPTRVAWVTGHGLGQVGTPGSGFPWVFFPAPRCRCGPATAGPRPHVDSTWTLCGVTARSWGISWCPKEPERKNELLPWLRRGRMSPGATPRLAHPSPARQAPSWCHRAPHRAATPATGTATSSSTGHDGDSAMAPGDSRGRGGLAARGRLAWPGSAVCFGPGSTTPNAGRKCLSSPSRKLLFMRLLRPQEFHLQPVCWATS